MFHNNSNYAYDNLLHTNIAGIEMQTPVLAASGTFGFGEEFADFVDLARLGGVMVKGTTLLPRCGNDGVRIAETPEGMLNCIGLENPGVDVFLTEILPRIRNYGMNVIVNISGSSVDDYAHIAARLNGSDIAARMLRRGGLFLVRTRMLQPPSFGQSAHKRISRSSPNSHRMLPVLRRWRSQSRMPEQILYL